MIRNLVLAYMATWLIHGGYLWSLLRKNLRLRRESEEPNQERGTNKR